MHYTCAHKTHNTSIDIYTYIHGSCTLVLQGVELPNADGASTVKEIDSLKQDVQDRDEEIKRLTSLLEAREEMAVRGGGGRGGAGGGGEGGSGEEGWEESDLRARLEEAEDRRMRAEEELKNLQSRLTEREKVTAWAGPGYGAVDWHAFAVDWGKHIYGMINDKLSSMLVMPSYVCRITHSMNVFLQSLQIYCTLHP